jgi:hypothetical protein
MSEIPLADVEGVVRDFAAGTPPSRGLRERVIARSVAARSWEHRESRLGTVLSATALTFLLAMAVWKHVPLVGITPAMINVSPAVIHWSAPGEIDGDGANTTSSNESREWRHVKRSTERQQEVSQLLTRCFGS